MASFLWSPLIRSLIKLSDILKNKCSVSIITRSIGIKSNNRLVLQLYCLDFACLPYMLRDLSVEDHFLLMSNLSCFGHLHQIQAKFWFAAAGPQMWARNFQSPPKEYTVLYLWLFTVIYFKFDIFLFRSARLSLRLS